MEYENPTSRQCLSPDIISNIPQNIIESILSRMPLRDAVRTSVLSKKWRYSWRGMPRLTFTHKMARLLSTSGCSELKCELAKAIYHVLLLHKGPQILEFKCLVSFLHMESEFAQIISYLAMRNCVKELSFTNDNSSYKLPSSFFSLQGLERMLLQNCTFEPPLIVNGFSQLKRMVFCNVEVTAQGLQRFLSKCPLLKDFILVTNDLRKNDFAAEGRNKFTFVDLFSYVPLIKTLAISNYYMKYLCAGASPHSLPTSLVHLKCVYLDVCLTEQNMISFTLFMLRISLLFLYTFIDIFNKISNWMSDNEKLPVQQTRTNFLDPENHPDLKLDHLETLDIRLFSGLPIEMEFVKLVMTKSHALKNVRIELDADVSVDEQKILMDMLLLLPFPQASPSAKLTVVRPY
ncbi:F-box/FBD/LRR-repeat protein At1g13570-like [Bidens hawaiensis]|uniref:F-box/FBD/LRR-repeat protein At1g13570-like n=1 Tax=Bidens hawaiensis TaxID=980011 RepID=UPI00404B552F